MRAMPASATAMAWTMQEISSSDLIGRAISHGSWPSKIWMLLCSSSWMPAGSSRSIAMRALGPQCCAITSAISSA
jgi:hypothetical protein